jgi:glycosyltransferase involved in cell wall biosynthesis
MLILVSMNESYGMVVPESWHALRIIISDTCGAKFFVENEKNGYIFETHNVEDLVNKLKMSKGKTERFGKFPAAYKKQVLKRKNTEKFVELLKQANYKEIIVK